MSRRTNFCIELDRIKKYAQNDKNADQLEMVNKTIKFAKEGTYIKRKNADEVLTCWGMTDKETSAELSLGAANIRLIRQHISDALYDRLGMDYISLLSIGDKSSLEECEKRLRVVRANKKASDYIPAVFIKEVRENAIDIDCNVRECRKEFDFIKDFSFANFRRRLASLDKDRVAHVLRVLNQECGTLVETDYLRRSIEKVEREVVKKEAAETNKESTEGIGEATTSRIGKRLSI